MKYRGNAFPLALNAVTHVSAKNRLVSNFNCSMIVLLISLINVLFEALAFLIVKVYLGKFATFVLEWETGVKEMWRG